MSQIVKHGSHKSVCVTMGILQSADSFLLEINHQNWTLDISCATRTVYLCGPFGGCGSHFTCPQTGLCFVVSDQERAGLVVTLRTFEKHRSQFFYKHTHS